MASRITLSSLRAVARPQVVAAVPRAINPRTMATSSKQPPAERASEIINSVPSSNLITKTGAIVLGSGLLATAISQELYVMNEETVLLVGSVILFSYITKSVREPYRDWANATIDKIRNVLEGARAEHTQAVKDRISSVEQMKNVVSITQGLFALSKETAKLESEAFVQQQKVALTSEVKGVLDSWVRYEQQVKESEQADLSRSVIEKVLASIKDEKMQKDILASAVAEVEQLVKNKAI